MSRINRHSMFMEIAHIVAKRGTCYRSCVGAVVVCNNRIVSIGYNGSPAGQPHCEGKLCTSDFCRRAIHAEINAIDYIPNSVHNQRKDIYITHSPCESCFNTLIKSVDRIFYENLYRINRHLIDVPIFRVLPSGIIINHYSDEIEDLV